MVFGRHVTKQRSDWPELFGMARTKESAQRYQTRGGRSRSRVSAKWPTRLLFTVYFTYRDVATRHRCHVTSYFRMAKGVRKYIDEDG